MNFHIFSLIFSYTQGASAGGGRLAASSGFKLTQPAGVSAQLAAGEVSDLYWSLFPLAGEAQKKKSKG